MNPIPVAGCSIVHVLLLASLTAASTNDGNYLLSCGASAVIGTTRSNWDGRTWQSDNTATFSTKFSSTISASTTAPSPGIPFSTARIFNSSFTYSFPVSPGPKFIRLFFNPASSPYSSASFSLPATDAYLTVQSSSDHILLRNFSASSFDCSSTKYFFKEFLVHIVDSLLQLTFIPTSSFAFINGIEVVSVPETLYINNPTTLKNVDQQMIAFVLGNYTALETAYRFNVGGNDVSLSQDSGNMSRTWVNDEPYLGDFHGEKGYYDSDMRIKYTPATPSYSAPAEVYESMRWMGNRISIDARRRVNVTWNFEVDIGFYYLLRLHWCEISTVVDSINYRVFDVYLNYQMAERAADIYGWANGGYTPIYRDYVVYMEGTNGGENRGGLQLSMHVNTDEPHKANDILLNGLEIFKINGSDGSLGALNPGCPAGTTPINLTPSKSASHIVPIIISVIAGAIVFALLFYILIFRRQKLWKTSATSSETTSGKSKRLRSAGKSGNTQTSRGGSSSLPTHLCRHFTLVEIRLATSDFSNSLIVGHGGFGNVYKGTVHTEAGPTTVAIKRLNPLSSQGAGEFKMEVELLSKLRHVNLVSLIGYCDHSGEMILVYEYMSRGTLRDHLYPYKTDSDAQLSWFGRLKICIGAARGLHYLHTGTNQMIIHRDVKSTNILLDERWDAKVSDFGLSKLGPAGGELSHVSTEVKGSFGYVDPEYYRRQQLTEKSDVYSFGVVLLEVLCGRAAVNLNLPKEQVNLRIWARRNQMSGSLDTIVDPTMKGQIAPECLRKFGEVAESCVRDEGAHRPSMADVIRGLELALQLQLESSVKTNEEVTVQDIGDDEYTPNEEFQPINISSPTTDASVRLIKSSGESSWTSINNSTSRLFSSTTSECYGESPAVFSQIFKPEGR